MYKQNKMTQEQLRMQMLAGIITESQYKAILNEEINFPELEDEFEGYQDAMLGSDEDYLQDIISSTDEELENEFTDIMNGGYYEVALGIEQGRYDAKEAVQLAKKWAQEKLNNL